MVEDPGKAEFNADLCGDRSSIENTIAIVKIRFTIMKHGFTYPDLTKCSRAIQGGFQLLDLIIPELKSHVTPYKFKCSHWWKIQL